MQNSNERVLLLPQCETKEALDNIEELTSLEGIDGIFIGPFDLSISMGIPGQFEHLDYIAAEKRIRMACAENEKLCMVFSGSVADAKAQLAGGVDAVAVGLDFDIYRQAYENLVKQLHF